MNVNAKELLDSLPVNECNAKNVDNDMSNVVKMNVNDQELLDST